MKLPTIPENSLILKLSGVSLAILIILVLAVAVLLIRKFNLSEKLKNFADKVIRFVFWNFLIRYFQVAFLNLNFASLTSVLVPESLQDLIISAIILAVLYCLVCLVGYMLITRPNEYLSLDKTKQRIGNLY
jgi:hypothetical protein